jgi:hypothetical protein
MGKTLARMVPPKDSKRRHIYPTGVFHFNQMPIPSIPKVWMMSKAHEESSEPSFKDNGNYIMQGM